MHVRTHRVSHSNPRRYCVLAIVPHLGYLCPASNTHRHLEQRVYLPTHILPRPFGGTYNIQFAKYSGLCTQDEIQRFGGRACLPGAMGVFTECH